MSLLLKRLVLSRSAARILRLHTLPAIHQQTVGEHTFNLLCLLHEMSEEPVSAALYEAALYHDVPEAVTGDVPSTAKWRSAALKKELDEIEESVIAEYVLPCELGCLTVEEAKLLHFCDLAELALFCVEEVDTGNRKLEVVVQRVLHAILSNGLSMLNVNTRELTAFLQYGGRSTHGGPT